jgi:DNA-binding CsgD family transcriptional regulator
VISNEINENNSNNEMENVPHIAVIDTNALSAYGLKSILNKVVPIADIIIYNDFFDLNEDATTTFVHYFVSTKVVLEHTQFFLERVHNTIVITSSNIIDSHLSNFNTISANQPIHELMNDILTLFRHAHSEGRNMPIEGKRRTQQTKTAKKKILTRREIDVLRLVVKGLKNREIAEHLFVAETTVITHRKNISAKLGIKKVGALTVYAVINGLIDADDI